MSTKNTAFKESLKKKLCIEQLVLFVLMPHMLMPLYYFFYYYFKITHACCMYMIH